MCVCVMLLNYAQHGLEAFEWSASVWWYMSYKIPLIQDEQGCYAGLCTASGITSTARSDTLPMRHITILHIAIGCY